MTSQAERERRSAARPDRGVAPRHDRSHGPAALDVPEFRTCACGLRFLAVRDYAQCLVCRQGLPIERRGAPDDDEDEPQGRLPRGEETMARGSTIVPWAKKDEFVADLRSGRDRRTIAEAWQLSERQVAAYCHNHHIPLPPQPEDVEVAHAQARSARLVQAQGERRQREAAERAATPAPAPVAPARLPVPAPAPIPSTPLPVPEPQPTPAARVPSPRLVGTPAPTAVAAAQNAAEMMRLLATIEVGVDAGGVVVVRIKSA